MKDNLTTNQRLLAAGSRGQKHRSISNFKPERMNWHLIKTNGFLGTTSNQVFYNEAGDLMKIPSTKPPNQMPVQCQFRG